MPTAPARGRIRRVLAGAATASVVLGLVAPTAAHAADPQPDQRIGRVPTAPKNAARAAAPADDTALDLGVTLRPRDPGALESFVTAVSTPGSPVFHQYLRTGEFAGRFGAAPADVAAVTAELTAAGLQPGAVESDGLTIPVKATVAQARKAFATDFDGYTLADGRAAFSNTEAPKVSGRAAAKVVGITGLNTLATAESMSRPAGKEIAQPKQASATERQLKPNYVGGQPFVCSDIKDQLTANGLRPMIDYNTPDTLTINTYQQAFGNGGAGATVAIMSLEEFDDQAIAGYQRCLGTSTNVSRVKVDGGPTVPAGKDVGVETALDIETVIGVAPNADVLVYQGADASTRELTATLRRIVTDNRAQTVSISWGMCEQYVDPAALQAQNLILQQAAAQGQSVFAASGDSGSTGCTDNNGAPLPGLATDSPASLPYLTSVGGTTVSDPYNTPIESVWNTPGGGASGGGVSATWSLDSATGYQAGVSGPGYANLCNAPAGRTCRQVPDVSALADPKQGYLILGYTDPQYLHWMIIGGTSFSAPLWAAMTAHANADPKCAAAGPLGFLNPQLYKLGSTPGLYDPTTGNNVVSASGYTGSLYQAGPGYDLATGLGTPRADKLFAQLCANLPASPAGKFNAVAPTRLLDTRNGAALAAYGETAVQVSGTAGIPASGVTSVVLNVTVTDPATDGHLTVYPSGGARPGTSNLNWTAGRTVPNLVTVPVGPDGKVRFYNGAWGQTQLIVDVQGYYGTAGGSTYLPSGPTRVLDTRTSGGALAAYATRTVPGSQLGAPSGTKAVVLNVTATDTRTDGHLTVYPSGTTLPSTSNLNWTAGRTVANQVIVPLGPDNSIKINNGSWGSAQVVVDVFGFLGANGGASFHSTTPQRLFDSRIGQATNSWPFGANEIRVLKLDGDGRLAKAKAVVLNVTVTNPREDGHLTLYPSGQSAPDTSNLNWSAGQTVPNMVTVPVGPDGTVMIKNGSWSFTDVLVDVFGYYS
ncbi:protease pro-enzyme activation domain-containing protein [Kitasatospora cineracea]|uniref:protease pro-enzyme activation domain-containing protein n=1 Tax=Kitasatospora cineracea TaxID=88074 RepID=UPI0036D89E90